MNTLLIALVRSLSTERARPRAKSVGTSEGVFAQLVDETGRAMGEAVKINVQFSCVLWIGIEAELGRRGLARAIGTGAIASGASQDRERSTSHDKNTVTITPNSPGDAPDLPAVRFVSAPLTAAIGMP